MPPFKKHIFICTNTRANDPDGSCGPKGALEIQKKFKERLKERGLGAEVRANQSGCLDVCQHGVSVVIYPAGIWYGGVEIKDIDEIIDTSIMKDGIVERLKIPLKNSFSV